jgi:HSP20 family protein
MPVRREQTQTSAFNPTNFPLSAATGGGYPMGALRDEIDRFFDDFFGNFGAFPDAGYTRPFGRVPYPASTGGYLPAIDVTDREDAVEVTVELPGMDEQDVDVSVSNDNLVIRGEKKQEAFQEGAGWARGERVYGSFQRMLPLPPGVDGDRTRASFDRGILRVTLPKLEPARARRVPIEATAQTGATAKVTDKVREREKVTT